MFWAWVGGLSLFIFLLVFFSFKADIFPGKVAGFWKRKRKRREGEGEGKEREKERMNCGLSLINIFLKPHSFCNSSVFLVHAPF